MCILGLDPGGNTGFAYGLPGAAPKSGCIRIDSSMSNGRRFCTLEGRVRHLISAYEVDEVYLEQPYIQTDPKRFDIKVAELGYGYRATILMACEKEGIPGSRVNLVTADTWRKHVLRITRKPKDVPGDNRPWLKQQAVLACAKRGWPIRSEDEAEACLIWEYACEQVQPQSTIGRLPLFEMVSP